jgi:hypothetical protein
MKESRNTTQVGGRRLGKQTHIALARAQWVEAAVQSARKNKKTTKMIDAHPDGLVEIIVRPAKQKRRKVEVIYDDIYDDVLE